MTEPRPGSFAFPPWRILDGAAVFPFACSRYGAFEERVWFPDTPLPDAPDEGLARLLNLLHVALGVSTYKAAAAGKVSLPPLTRGGHAMARRLYTDGLAEFFVRAGLPYPPQTRFEVEEAPPAGDVCESDGPALVAFGGGKDSYVADAIVREAGDEAILCAVVMAETVERAISATAPRRVTFLRRSLDPKLGALDGAYNGHVPITAINALILAVYGRLTGAGAIVFANERSADEPTMIVDGHPANHQDSKSSGFEALLAEAVREADRDAPVPCSVLRPYAEPWIARGFVRLGEEPSRRFTSCNRNFRLAGDAASRWCGGCAKCAFTSLLLSPHLTRPAHLAAFEDDFLSRETLAPFQEELLGLTDRKPWDCVGTIDECRATLWQLSRHRDWADSDVVTRFLPRVLAETDDSALAAAWEEAFVAYPAPAVPARYADAASRLWG